MKDPCTNCLILPVCRNKKWGDIYNSCKIIQEVVNNERELFFDISKALVSAFSQGSIMRTLTIELAELRVAITLNNNGTCLISRINSEGEFIIQLLKRNKT